MSYYFEFVHDLPPRDEAEFVWRPDKRSDLYMHFLSEFALACTARPHIWGKYPFPLKNGNTARNRASHISNHTLRAPEPLQRGFEATARGRQLYVRYVGNE